MTAPTEDLIARLEGHDGSHERGCEGRNYACTCGDDDAGEKLITEAAQALRALQQEVERKDSALAVCAQALLEVKMAQSRGSSWYTRGDRGLYEQVDMWVRRGETAIDQARAALTGSAKT